MPHPDNLRPLDRRVEPLRHDSQPQEVRYNSDGSYYIAKRYFNVTGGATVVGRPYRRTNTGANLNNPQVSALAALAAVYQDVVVALEAVANNAWCWCAVYGDVDCGVEGTADVAAGNFLRVVAATSALALVVEAAATTKTVNTVATAKAAQAANSVVNVRVHLHGDRAVIG
ncbi:MAG: hypothetical protein ACREJW_00760 [Candidatus Methylomirabilales bacterium]